jgi:hypothetical protein
MATLKESIDTAIKPCCRNRACAEQAADVAIKLVEEKFKSNNTHSAEIALYQDALECLKGFHPVSFCNAVIKKLTKTIAQLRAVR